MPFIRMRRVGGQEGGKMKGTLGGCPGPAPHLPPLPSLHETSVRFLFTNPIHFLSLANTCIKNAAVEPGVCRKRALREPARYCVVVEHIFFPLQRPLPVDSKRVPVTVRLAADRGQQMPCDAPATCRKRVLSLGNPASFHLWGSRPKLPASGLGPGAPGGLPPRGVGQSHLSFNRCL